MFLLKLCINIISVIVSVRSRISINFIGRIYVDQDIDKLNIIVDLRNLKEMSIVINV